MTLAPAPRRGAAIAALGLGLALIAGCASGPATPASTASAPGTPSTSADAEFPVTVTVGDSTVTLEQQPTRIVSLSPTATEMLFAIDADAQVVAVDDQSDFPEEAPDTALSGFQPNAEAVAEYDPDLVVASNDANGLVAALTALDVPVLLLPSATTLDDVETQLVALGDATGQDEQATQVATQTEERITAAIASVPADAKGRKVYHELDPTFFSVTSDTFIGSLYESMGLVNIADSAQDASGGYPQLSSEFIVTQAPDLIVLADTECCAQTATTVAERPGWSGIPAVVNGQVLEGDDDIASRWGPRVADFAESVAAELKE